ncbi:hypothetical protein KI387_009974, partial [Taxus chinensis]
GFSSKAIFQEHELWLQYAKTRSARHKIMKYLKEQTEKSANAGKFFVADMEGTYQEDEDDLIKAIMQSSMLHTMNGKCNKLITEVGLKLNGDSEILRKKETNFKLNILQMDEEVLARLEKWKSGKVANWHGPERKPVQWFNVCCIDRKDNENS